MRLMKLQTYSTIKNRRDHHLAVFHQDEKPASPVLGCPGVSGKGVWEAVWDLQDEAHKRSCKELSEMGHVSSIATARCDHLKTYDRKPVIITGGCAGLQRTPSSSMET
jgi:hypothetical protein